MDPSSLQGICINLPLHGAKAATAVGLNLLEHDPGKLCNLTNSLSEPVLMALLM